jgi:hypothetical protein
VTRLPAVMVDVDGTVALKGDRGIYDLSLVGIDLPNLPVTVTAQALREAGYALIFCSGRKDTARSQTEAWLRAHVGQFEMLLMRARTDDRPDYEVKVDLYRKWIEPDWDVLLVLDDRASVTRAWRSLGLTVLQCAEGDF